MADEIPFPVPDPASINKKAIAVRENLKKSAGRPVGPHSKQILLQSPEQQDQLVEEITARVLTGKEAFARSTLRTPLTNEDKSAILRATNMTVDEFNARLAEKLGTFADRVLERMNEKLDQDLFKPNELSFAMAIALDKRANLEGRNALQNANIAIQVNNYAGPKKSKAEMIRSLTGEDDQKTVELPPA